ncbi:MAG: SLC13 family permease [Pyrinomonadaceae bacterium]|nr:SLC13 family permease [Pyrinomonadaceae bacterium]
MVDIAIVSAIVVIALILFATEKIRVDLVAISLMVVLMIIGLFRESFVTPQEAISGLSNKATVTIGAMFILSAGMLKSGAMSWLSQKLVILGGSSETRIFVVLMVACGFLSAFINNAITIAVFLPISLTIARQYNISPSNLLMPLSFISIVGGTCTLIGTSTNILVSSMSAERGYGEFGMFTVTPLGIIFFAVGFIYLIFIARPMLSRLTGLTRRYRLQDYFTLVKVSKVSTLIGTTPAESHIHEKYGVMIIKIRRGDKKIIFDVPNTVIEAGDTLLVQGTDEGVEHLCFSKGCIVQKDKSPADHLTDGGAVLTEAVISPSSTLVGQTLKRSNFRFKYGAFVLAIRKPKAKDIVRESLVDVKFEVGDTLLLQGEREMITDLARSSDFVITQETELPDLDKPKAVASISIIGMVILLAAFGVMPILASALLGVVLMIFSRCLTMQEAYDSIDWFVIFLLAGVIPLGLSLEKTGATDIIAQGILSGTEQFGPIAVISIFYFVTTIFASIMSHNAAVVILFPIAIAASNKLGLGSPMPFLMAITFAASSSLSTPFGYHTNLMVYGPGGYKFSDYIYTGVPLNIMFWILATLLIPVFWF